MQNEMLCVVYTMHVMCGQNESNANKSACTEKIEWSCNAIA